VPRRLPPEESLTWEQNVFKKWDHMVEHTGGARAYENDSIFGELNNPAYPRSGSVSVLEFGGKNHTLPHMQNILAVTGAINCPQLFYYTLATSHDTEVASKLYKEIGEKRFMTADCVRYAMHMSAVELVAARSPGYNKSFHPVDAMHDLAAVVFDFTTEVIKEKKHGEEKIVKAKQADVETFFDNLEVKLTGLDETTPHALERVKYAGAYFGIYLAGMLQYALNDKERAEKKARHIEGLINGLGAFVSLIPKAGGTLAGLMASVGPSISYAMTHHKDPSPAVVKWVAGLDDLIASKHTPDLASAFATSVQVALKRSGFPA
jgi:hypothetical protein